MRCLIAILFAAIPCWPAACTLGGNYNLSASGGHWTGTGCTGGAFIPGNGDTANVSNASKLTVDQNWTIGSSPATNGTAAITTNASGSVEVLSGATLRVRGDVTSGTRTVFIPYILTMDAGSHLIFDSSQASSPTTTRYRFGPSSGNAGGMQVNGQVNSHVTITSDLTNGALPAVLQNGPIGSPATFWYGSINGTYGDLSYLGDASYPMLHYGLYTADPPSADISIQHFTFDYCSSYGWWDDNWGLASNTTFLFDHNSFTNSTGKSNLYLRATTSPADSITWVVSNNSFDKRYNDGDGACNAGTLFNHISFIGNFFGRNVCGSNVTDSTASSYTDNFFIDTIGAVGGGQLQTNGNITGGYIFNDVTAADNPHALAMSQQMASVAQGFVMESPDDFTSDSGELLIQSGTSAAYSTVLQNTIVLPSKTGNETMELSAASYSVPGVGWGDFSALHNTWVGGWHFGMIQTNEGGANLKPMAAVESNLAWSLSVAYPKVGSVQYDSLLQNPVTTADYNSADSHLTLTDPACSGCTNQGRGYIGKWTATPGTHDVTANPYLADPLLRNVALWDTRYLGNALAAPWNGSSHVYSVGELVSDSHAGYWSGATINFRCTSAHTSGASTEPNVGASWRTAWEFASLADLRSATVAGTAYTDGAIGCAGCTAIQALVKWVQRGYTPQNPALWCAGHDGETIGAVPFCATGRVMIGSLAGM